MDRNKDLKQKKNWKMITLITLICIITCISAGVWLGLHFIQVPQSDDSNNGSTLSALWSNMFQTNIDNDDEDMIVEDYIPYEMSEYIFTDMDYETKVSTLYPKEEIQAFLENEVNHVNSIAGFLGNRSITGETVAYDGQDRSITCWGDSMTEGNGTCAASITVNDEDIDISYCTFPSVLEELTGITTYNLGVGGETSIQIAQRQGGLKMVTDRDLNVPSTGAVGFNLVSAEYGIEVDIGDYSGYGMTNEKMINKVYIDDKMFKLTFNGDSHMLYKKLSHKNKNSSNDSSTSDGSTSNTSTSDSSSTNSSTSQSTDTTETTNSTYIPAGTQVYTAAAVERKDDILIIEMGSNGGWDSLEELIAQYDAMIAYANTDYYIIIGDTDDPEYAAGLGDTPWEAALREAYGDHFINMRTYLIENGLNDCGLDTTYADMECYYNGQISKQLRADWTHLNAYGYYSKGIAVYEKGVELGYWD